MTLALAGRCFVWLSLQRSAPRTICLSSCRRAQVCEVRQRRRACRPCAARADPALLRLHCPQRCALFASRVTLLTCCCHALRYHHRCHPVNDAHVHPSPARLPASAPARLPVCMPARLLPACIACLHACGSARLPACRLVRRQLASQPAKLPDASELDLSHATAAAGSLTTCTQVVPASQLRTWGAGTPRPRARACLARGASAHTCVLHVLSSAARTPNLENASTTVGGLLGRDLACACSMQARCRHTHAQSHACVHAPSPRSPPHTPHPPLTSLHG